MMHTRVNAKVVASNRADLAQRADTVVRFFGAGFFPGALLAMTVEVGGVWPRC